MSQIQRAIGLALIALAPLFQACQSTSGTTTANSTVASAKSLQAAVETLNQDVGSTAAALEALRATTVTQGLINKSEKVVGDMPAAFKAYAKSVDGLEAQSKAVTSKGEAFKKSFTAYVTDWEASMAKVENADVRKAADQRRTDARKTFDATSTQVAQMQTRFAAMLTDFVGIRTALQHDMNPDGMKAIDGVMTRAVKSSTEVQSDTKKVSTALESFASKLLALAPPPAPAPQPKN